MHRRNGETENERRRLTIDETQSKVSCLLRSTSVAPFLLLIRFLRVLRALDRAERRTTREPIRVEAGSHCCYRRLFTYASLCPDVPLFAHAAAPRFARHQRPSRRNTRPRAA